jgi:F420H(2)-dependent quinone reductase
MSPLATRITSLVIGTHVRLYRASKGKVGGSIGGNRLGLLTTVGRRSGRPRTVPVTTFPQDDGSLVVVASNGGQDRPPAWYGNLRANPQVHLQLGAELRPMLARTATAQEKAEIWPGIVARAKNFAGYQKKTNRDIPVVILTPGGPGS